MSGLPKGWAITNATAVADPIRGVTYKKEQARETPAPGYTAVLRANNIQQDKLTLAELVYVQNENIASNQMLKRNDVVIAMSSGSISVVGKAAQVEQELTASFGAFCGALRPGPEIQPRYLGWFLKSDAYRNGISRLARGVNINNLKWSHFEEIPLPLAPLPEQKRIADKLDSVLARVEACRDRLNRIPALLKRFRQSVLAAATSGRLTENWRTKNGANEMTRVVRLGELFADGPQNGLYKPSTVYGAGIGILRIDMFYDGEVTNWAAMKRLEVTPSELLAYGLSVGDIVVNRVNSPPYVGKAALIRALPEPCVFESNMMRIRLDGLRILTEYCIRFLSSMEGLAQLRRNVKHAVNQASINQTDVKSVEVPLPRVIALNRHEPA